MIADFDVTEQMLRHFIQRVNQQRFAHPRVVVCVPSGVTGVEKRAVAHLHEQESNRRGCHLCSEGAFVDQAAEQVTAAKPIKVDQIGSRALPRS